MKKLSIILCFLFLAQHISRAQIENPKFNDNSNKSNPKILVYIKTGEIYKGFFISQDKNYLVLETESDGTLRIPTVRIKSIESIKESAASEPESQKRLDQVNPMRYMVGTSSFNYEKGGNYIRINPLTYHRGVTDNFSIGVGTSFWLLLLRAPLIYINPQFTKQLGKYVHCKIGLDALVATLLGEGESSAAAILNTGVTIGEPDLNFTGTVYWGALTDFDRLDPFYSLAGMARVSRKIMLVTEAFYIPSEFIGSTANVFYGGRVITRSATYDLGFFYNQEIGQYVPVGIPLIAITKKL